MKKIVMMVILVIAYAGNILAEERKELGVQEYDEILDRTKFSNSYFTHYINSTNVSMKIFMDHETETIKPSLLISYCGDDWIFFDTAYLFYDGNRISFENDSFGLCHHLFQRI